MLTSGHLNFTPKSHYFRRCVPALLFLALAYPATILAQANPTARYTISPGSVQRGTGLNDVYLQATDQQHKDLSDITEVAASDGSGVSFKSKQLMNDNQLLKIKLDVSEDAEAGVTRLSITRKAPTATDANATKTETVDLTIIELKPLAPGPIPTKSPQVDAMWALVPDKVVKDNFGKRIADQFYCVEIVLGNNSGYSLEISGVGFESPEYLSSVLPTSSRRMVRQSIVREQTYGTRAVTVNALKSVGTLASGFIPFFHAASHMANFATGTSIFANQFERGFEAAVPDLTTRQLGRIDEEIVRDSTIISNNRTERMVAFIPKALFPIEKEAGKSSKEANSPAEIVKRLGKLVIIGKPILDFEARQIVVARRRATTTSSDLAANERDNGFSERQTVSASGADNNTLKVAAPRVFGVIVYEAGSPPKTNAQKDQLLVITINGENLGEFSTVLTPIGAAENRLEVVSTQMAEKSIVATIRVKKGTPAGTYQLEIDNGSEQKATVDFIVQP